MADAPGCPVDATFDPLSAAYLDDPFAVMAALPLAESPVFYAPSIGYYVVTRYHDIEQVFADPATYSAAAACAWSISRDRRLTIDDRGRPEQVAGADTTTPDVDAGSLGDVPTADIVDGELTRG